MSDDTMIERLARAAAKAALEFHDGTPDSHGPELHEDWEAIVRAVLTELREPDDGMKRAACAALAEHNQRRDGNYAASRLSWRAMLDHILSQ